MRRWISLAGKLYPRAWRERYGTEFDALLEDVPADCRQLLNVTRAALRMQLREPSYGKVAGGLALVGALLATAASYCLPPRYVSSATLHMVPVRVGGLTDEMLQRQMEDRIEDLKAWVALHPFLLEMARNPALDLYRERREHGEPDDVARQLRDDLEIRAEETPAGDGANVRVSFAYPDREKARAVVGELVTQMQQLNERWNRDKAEAWEYQWWQQPDHGGVYPFRGRLQLVEPADLPGAAPQRLTFLASGILGGLLLGLLGVLFHRHPRAGLQLAACGLAGCALGAGVSLGISEQHTATVVMRLSAPFDPKRLAGILPTATASEWVARLKRELLSPHDFPRPLNLDRDRLTMRMLDATSFEIGYRNRDAQKAREDVRAAEAHLIWLYQEDIEKDARAIAGRDGEYLRQIVSLPQGQFLEKVQEPKPVNQLTATHYRLAVTVAAALLGMLLSLVRRRRAPNQTLKENHETNDRGPFRMLPGLRPGH